MEFTNPLIHHLFNTKLISLEQAESLLDEHQRKGISLRDLILEKELLSEDQLLQAIAHQLGAHVVNLREMVLSDTLMRTLPASVARMYHVLPVRADDRSMTLATCENLNPEIVDELRFVLTRDIAFVVARKGDLHELLKEHYGDDSESVSDMLSVLGVDPEDSEQWARAAEEDGESIDLEHMASSTPVVRFVNLVLYQAVKDQASDIHFEPFEHEFKIRYRIDGALYEMVPPPKHLALPVVSRIKVIAGLNIAERRLPQDGRIKITVAGKPIDFRVSTLPTQFGESVVLRVLDRSVVSLDLENLGMPEDIYEAFSGEIHKPNGIIIVTGPTGSGKTTTLYSGLRRINKMGSKLLTAEEPVEYDIEGLIQVSVNDAIDLTFAKALRAFLRQDPDVIMVGEIRDLETAEIAIQASLTGHLVFSTLHTNDSSGAVTRLIDMGVEPFLLSSTVEAILGQRLLRTICEQCKTAYLPDETILERLGLKREELGARSFYYGEGCARCNSTGYKGRRGIYEFLQLSEPLRDLINDRKPTIVVREKARELGMRTLREDGIRCILDGTTTVDEVLKTT